METKSISNEEQTTIYNPSIVYNTKVIDGLEITVTPENINLLDDETLFLSMYVFNVKGVIIDPTNLFESIVAFECKIKCNWNRENWEFVSIEHLHFNQKVLSDYVELEHHRSLQSETIYNTIMRLIPTEIMEMIQDFTGIFDNNYNLIKIPMDFLDSTVGIKKVRKTSTGVYCRISLLFESGKLTNLYGYFNYENRNNENFPFAKTKSFVLDAFQYEEINIKLVEYIEQHGSALRVFLNEYVKYNRVI